MKVLVQWSQENPLNWQEIDALDWRDLPSKPTPLGGEPITNERGWIHHISCQGHTLGGFDHYAVERVVNHRGSGIKITCWTDDPEDIADPSYGPTRGRHAKVVHFYPLKADPTNGGAINTDQSVEFYAEGEYYRKLMDTEFADPTKIHPWASFPEPDWRMTKHGIWVPDDLHDLHEASVSSRPWMEWSDGVDKVHLDDDGSVVADQAGRGFRRPPEGTITYIYKVTTHLSVSNAIMNNQATEGTTTTSTVQQQGSTNGTDEALISFTTTSGNPNSADWPNGTYGYSCNFTTFVKVANTKLEMHRTNSSGTSQEQIGSTQTYTTTGTKTYAPTVDPGGDATHLYQLLDLATSDGSHSKATVTININTASDYVEGPWTPPASTRRIFVVS
jgi:hypothetical protein